jgi:retron-type reverse transcriptase
LFNPQLYLLAYGRIYSNKGAMTPGPDAETADGMSMGKIERIIDALRHERYRFRPVRRHYIPKKGGRKRPLGLPSWSDKLVGEVVRLLLEAYYEPRFRPLSWFPAWPGVPHRVARGGEHLDGNDLVYRGRHLSLL